MNVEAALIAWNLVNDYSHSAYGVGAIADADLDLHEKLSLAHFAVSLPELLTDKRCEADWTANDRLRLATILRETTEKFTAAF